MDIQKEFTLLEQELLQDKENIIEEIKKEVSKTETNIEKQLIKYELIETIELEEQIILVVDKFYQKLINLNKMIRKNLLFNIKNKPKDLMFLQENIIGITIESKSVQVKDEIKGKFELILYNLTVVNRLDAYTYKFIKDIFIDEEKRLIPKLNNILTKVLEENKKSVIKKYREIMEEIVKNTPNKYKESVDFVYNYALNYLKSETRNLYSHKYVETNSKIKEKLEELKEQILVNNKISKTEINKHISVLKDYLLTFNKNIFDKINDILDETTKTIFSSNLKDDLNKYNNFINRLLDKDIVLDKQFMNLNKKILSNKKVKKDIENIKEIEKIINNYSEEITSTIKINILDTLKTNSFNINKTITCTNFIKYSTKEKIEDLEEKDLIKMFDMLIKN